MNILIAGAVRFTEENIAKIESLGHRTYRLQFENDELPLPYAEVDAVICNGLFSHHSIENFTNLKHIQLTSAGMDHLPMEYIDKNNIKLFNAKGVYSVPMAEFALASVLSIYKDLYNFRKNQINKVWEKNRNLLELFNKEVCIVGCGSIGTECAKRFKAMGCKVTGVNRSPKTIDVFDEIHSINDMKEVIKDKDIVIITVPLNQNTYHMFNKETLENLKENSMIVNLSRGAVIDTEAMIDMLKNKDIVAVLDVFENEPLETDSELWNLENVLITPHNSFVGENNTKRLFQITYHNLKEN